MGVWVGGAVLHATPETVVESCQAEPSPVTASRPFETIRSVPPSRTPVLPNSFSHTPCNGSYFAPQGPCCAATFAIWCTTPRALIRRSWARRTLSCGRARSARLRCIAVSPTSGIPSRKRRRRARRAEAAPGAASPRVAKRRRRRRRRPCRGKSSSASTTPAAAYGAPLSRRRATRASCVTLVSTQR